MFQHPLCNRVRFTRSIEFLQLLANELVLFFNGHEGAKIGLR